MRISVWVTEVTTQYIDTYKQYYLHQEFVYDLFFRPVLGLHHPVITRPALHHYLSVEQEADQAFTQLLQDFAGHPLDRRSLHCALSQLGQQEALPLTPECKSCGQHLQGLLGLPQLQLQPAVHHQARTVGITVHGVCYQQQSLMRTQRCNTTVWCMNGPALGIWKRSWWKKKYVAQTMTVWDTLWVSHNIEMCDYVTCQ